MSIKIFPEIPDSDSGYVLIARCKGFKGNHVYFRFSREIIMEFKRRLEQRDDVMRVDIEPASLFQERIDRNPHHHEQRIDVLRRPMISTLDEEFSGAETDPEELRRHYELKIQQDAAMLLAPDTPTTKCPPARGGVPKPDVSTCRPD